MDEESEGTDEQDAESDHEEVEELEETRPDDNESDHEAELFGAGVNVTVEDEVDAEGSGFGAEGNGFDVEREVESGVFDGRYGRPGKVMLHKYTKECVSCNRMTRFDQASESHLIGRSFGSEGRNRRPGRHQITR